MAIHFSNAFLDIDYTITNFQTGHNAALDFLQKRYGSQFAIQFDLVFRIILFSLRVKDDDWSNVPGGKEAYLAIIKKIQQLQKIENNPTIWSRELHAMIALEKCGMNIDENEAIKIADLYWDKLASDSEVYADARAFLALLNKNHIPYHFFTGSDGRLVFENGLWKYDPDYSSEKKMKRIVSLEQYGITPASITIGDPEDKPNPTFYSKMMSNASQSNNRAVNPMDSIVVGDSFVSDVSAPMKQYNFKFGYWINRQGVKQIISDHVYSITSLKDIPVIS